MNSLFKPFLQQNIRNQSLWLLLCALSLAICATTALKFSNAQVQQAVRLQAAQMLAGDLSLTDQSPIQPKYLDQAQQLQLAHSNVTVFGTMARNNQQFVMVTAKAIDANYPLRGQLGITPNHTKIQKGELWLSPRAQDLLQAKLGDEINIADAKLKFTGVIQRDLNQEMGFSGFSPSVILSAQDIAQTHAIQTGSRIEYRLLLAGTAQAIGQYQQWFKKQQPKLKNGTNNEIQGNLQLRNAEQGNTRLLKPLKNLDVFLQLGNLVTLLLCGIAIALASRRFVAQSQDQIALLRCLGAKRAQILTISLFLMLGLMVVSTLLGWGIGLGLGAVLLHFIVQFVPNLVVHSGVDSIFPALGTAFLTSAAVLLGFIAPNLYQLFRVPPIRVIRPDTTTRKRYFFSACIGMLCLVGLSFVLTRNLGLTFSLLAAITLIGSVFFVALWLLLRWLKQRQNRFSAYLRLPAQTAAYITILALAVSLMAVLWVLKTDLLTRWQQQLPANTPNQFVYGLAPTDKPAFEQQLIQYKWAHTPLYPNIRARLVAKNDQPFSAQLVQQNNSLRRELNLTQSVHYPADNKIIAGRAQLLHAGEVSVEDKTAQALGIHLGDQLTFQLPEGDLKAKVVNFRKVTWESFSPNFFFIFAPESMDDNAGSYLGSFYVPPQDNAKLLSLIEMYNTTVFIDIANILDQVKALLHILAQVISILAILVAISGFLVLLACLNILMDERKYEVALLRALGSSQQQIKRMFSIEFGFIGLCAGMLACLFAEAMGMVVALKLDLSMQLHASIWLVLPVFMMLLCLIIARFRFRAIYQISPMIALKS
ncbi:ABC transporter permease [Acinetobacter sp. MD2(2019)]|uniref:ABC transporter permease n=1 Tax=Acinetobacter sp. MD2(2019) TaxID=2605273 RepID=UPI002D1F3AEC|nr:FtsX-like permease family protein [Acinetobacter sp. MD2(2019)]MEB3754040.1 FtsX-like permease family protein [Acinetobacter sp. MD2(2019)]